MPELTKEVKEEYAKKTKVDGFVFLAPEWFSEIDNKLHEFQTANPVLFSDNKAERNDERYDNLRKEPDLVALSDFQNGDYTKFSALPKMFQDYALTKIKADIYAKLANANEEFKFDIANSDCRQYLEEQSVNPLFQTALELIKAEEMDKPVKDNNAEEMDKPVRVISPEKLTEAVDFINTRVMEKTLAPVDNRDRRFTNKDIQINAEKQATVATALLLTHLGDTYINPDSKKGIQQEGNGVVKNAAPASELFAHGGRTVFVMPKGNNGNALTKAMIKSDDTEVVEGRKFATHDVIRGKDKDGNTTFKEIKPKASISEMSPGFTFMHNTGMNVAIGGLGQKFGDTSDWTINNKGQDGHVFIRMEDSTEDTNGYVLMGFEGEAPGEKGRLGNKHDASAVKAPISMFGATKHAVGHTYDGRRVELGKYDQTDLTDVIKKFKEKYVALQVKASMEVENAEQEVERDKAKADLDRINKKLSGTPMTPENVMDMLRSDGIAITEHSLYNQIDPNYQQKAIPNLETAEELDNKLVTGIQNYERGRNLVNPKLAFIKDRMEIAKKPIKKDDAAKKISKLIDTILDAEVGRDEEKYANGLANIYKACSKYLNSTKSIDPSIKQLYTDLLKETEKEYAKTTGVADIANAEFVRSETLDNGFEDILEVDMTIKEAQKNIERANNKAELNAMDSVLTKFDKELKDAAKETWRDSAEFKAVQKNITDLQEIIAKDAKKNYPGTTEEYDKAVMKLYTSACEYISVKNKGEISLKSEKKMKVVSHLLDGILEHTVKAIEKQEIEDPLTILGKREGLKPATFKSSRDKVSIDELNAAENGGNKKKAGNVPKPEKSHNKNKDNVLGGNN